MPVRWLLICLLLATLLASVVPQSFSRGSSSSNIIFGHSGIPARRPRPRPFRRPGPNRGTTGTVQFGQTSATSEQTSTGSGQQTNRGQASGVSFQQQSGLGGATQTTNNQALIQALQQAGGGGGGGGGGRPANQQSSNNQVNIQSSQLQQNVQGTLVNVEAGSQGVVIVNTQDQTGHITGQQVVNNRPIAAQTAGSSRCRHTCRRRPSDAIYCCDDGTNRRGRPAIHGGRCPPTRLLCPQAGFFRNCAHDGQCAASDKCCYDACANHHICKSPDAA